MTAHHKNMIVSGGVALADEFTKTFLNTGGKDGTLELKCGDNQVMVGVDVNCKKRVGRVEAIHCAPIEYGPVSVEDFLVDGPTYDEIKAMQAIADTPMVY